MSKLGILDFSSLHNTTQALLLHIDTNQGQPPIENQNFLKSIPPSPTFADIPRSDNNWTEKVAQQGEAIRQKLLENFPLAFKNKNDFSPSSASVPLIHITVDSDAKIVNRKTRIKIPIGMEGQCNDLIDRLLKQDKIGRNDKITTWCSPARFVRKASGAPRLVINHQGLNGAGERIGYPFKSAAEIHQMIEKKIHIHL